MSLLRSIGKRALEGATDAAKDQVKIWLKETFNKTINNDGSAPGSKPAKQASSPDTSDNTSPKRQGNNRTAEELRNLNNTMESVVKNTDQTNTYLWTSIGKQAQTNLLLGKLIEKLEADNKKGGLLNNAAEAVGAAGAGIGGATGGKSGLGKFSTGMKVGGALAALGATQSAYNEFGQSGSLGRAAAVGSGNLAGGMGGAWAGAKLGALGGSFAGPIGTTVGGIGGALIGGYFGSSAGEAISKKLVEKNEIKPTEEIKSVQAIAVKKPDQDNMNLNLKSLVINAAEIKINGSIIGLSGTPNGSSSGVISSTGSGISSSGVISSTGSGISSSGVISSTGSGISSSGGNGLGMMTGSSAPTIDMPNGGQRSIGSGSSRNTGAGYQRQSNGSEPNNYPIKPGTGKSSDELGSLSAKYEGKVGSANPDNIGWAYGKYQFNSATGGLSKFFKDNPEYAKQFEGLTPGTPQFASKWKEIAATDKENFGKAQTKSATNLWYNPAASHAKKLGFNTDNRGIQEAIFSGSINHGGINTILSNTAKSGDISKMTPEQQIAAFYEARRNYVSSSSKIDERSKASLLKRYSTEERDALQYSASQKDGMAPKDSRVIEAQSKLASIRTQALDPKVKDILNYAANKNGVYAEVFSGGQDGIGSGGRRTGSTRHDHGQAADTKFYKLDENGKKVYLDMNEDREKMASIVKDAAAAGATGIGGAANYMGTKSLHIGLGSQATWGRKGERAPAWLSNAAKEGWDNKVNLAEWKKQNDEKNKVVQRDPLKETIPVTQRSMWDYAGIGKAEAAPAPVRTETSPIISMTSKQDEDNAIDYAMKLNSTSTKGKEVLDRSTKDSINESKKIETSIESIKETTKESKSPPSDINQKEPSKASPSSDEVKKLMEEWS